ncbi:NADPH-dependent glutamate synthase [Deferrisoma camini]|uniref:NADPH-dependent glutamate synthase n=1 Tax=Deferrisoma camini TaxID=1035120 RepID=UPI00046D5AB3|nr:NADPH-dependent glutamate synthase [Deferrisoma camini]
MAKKQRPPRTPMPEQDPKVRARNFDEVPLGYTPEMAQREASRCLKCKKPACRKGCPVEVFIPDFIAEIEAGNFQRAVDILKKKNSLPAVCGRVCPQENQCEAYCIVGKKSEPVAIGRLERFAADWERAQGDVKIPEIPPKTGKRVAVVGSGPAGLTVAGDLVLKGHDVTVFEALHKPGGVLVYGIPEFRLPKAIVQAEVDYLKKLGVKVVTNFVVGKMRTVEELIQEDGFDAVFVGAGAGLPKFMGIPGENLNGVYSANEYLTRSNLMKAYRFPEYDTPIVRAKRVAILGGGNVAMDAARTALRLGAERSIIVYRRGRDEMPARAEEIHHAEEEGVEFQLLTNPVRVIGDDNGWVRALECIRMELGEPDESGRRRPVPVEGSEFELDVDAVVVAIGNAPNPLIPSTTPAIQTSRWGTIQADEATGATTMVGVYAGGDVVTGAATVILAMGAGRKAADAIHDYLTKGG